MHRTHKDRAACEIGCHPPEIIKSHLREVRDHRFSAAIGARSGITCKMHGKPAMELVLSRLSSYGLQIVAADADRAVRSSLIKLKRETPYVDASGVELASDLRDRVFVTADFDFKPVSRDVTIEFLPAK